MAEEKNNLKPLTKFFKLLEIERQDIVQVYFYAILAGLLNLTLPLGIQSIINLIGGAQLSTSWVIMILLITVAALLSGIFQIIQLSITEKIQQRIFARTSFRFAIRIPRLKMEKTGQ